MLLMLLWVVVVLMAIPALWDWIVKRAYSEASQLKRRVAAMIHVSRMLAVDAELFLRDRVGCQGVDGRALALCCEAGSEFGGWKLLEKVAKLLRAQECDKPTLADVTAALAAAKSQWTWR